MGEVEVPADRIRDTVGVRSGAENGRDPCRTPFPWDASATNGGFADAGEPWLPLGDARGRDVATQRLDPGSTLHFVRDLIALRRSSADLRDGAYRTIEAPSGAWAWRRGDTTTVVVNVSDAPARLSLGNGEIAIATDRSREGTRVDAELELAPWSGVVLVDR
jgi:alpha-glucosidase